MVTYIFREGNVCADKLANLGFIIENPFIGIIGFHLLNSLLIGIVYLCIVFVSIFLVFKIISNSQYNN